MSTRRKIGIGLGAVTVLIGGLFGLIIFDMVGTKNHKPGKWYEGMR